MKINSISSSFKGIYVGMNEQSTRNIGKEYKNDKVSLVNDVVAHWNTEDISPLKDITPVILTDDKKGNNLSNFKIFVKMQEDNLPKGDKEIMDINTIEDIWTPIINIYREVEDLFGQAKTITENQAKKLFSDK